MTTTYTVVACDPLGRRLYEFSNFTDEGGQGLEYVLSCAPGGIGALRLVVPATVPLTMFPKDGRLLPYRSIAGRPPALDNNKVYLIRHRKLTATTTTVTAYDATSILQRRIIAYAAGTSYAQKAAAPAGNQLKAFAREQLTAPVLTPGGRIGDSTGCDVSAYLSIQADLGDGQSVAKAAAWRNLHDVATELAQASATAGTYLTFEILAPTESTLELRTYSGQRGIDRRAGTGSSLLFSVERGTLENVELNEDWSSQVTYAIAGGTGEGIYRGTGYGYSGTTVAASPFGRIEHFYENNQTADNITLRDFAYAQLYGDRARVVVTGDLVETSVATRGLHYDLGDYVTVVHRGIQYDMRLDTLHVQTGGSGQNQLEGGRALDPGYVVRQGAFFRTD